MVRGCKVASWWLARALLPGKLCMVGDGREAQASMFRPCTISVYRRPATIVLDRAVTCLYNCHDLNHFKLGIIYVCLFCTVLFSSSSP